MRNVHMMHMSPFRDGIFMMQRFHVGVQMQSLSMMVSAHIFKLQCKCLLEEVEMQRSYGANAL